MYFLYIIKIFKKYKMKRKIGKKRAQILITTCLSRRKERLLKAAFVEADRDRRVALRIL